LDKSDPVLDQSHDLLHWTLSNEVRCLRRLGVQFISNIIREADSCATVLAKVNVEISQLEPGRLRGRHLRVRLPGGQFCYVETGLSLRGPEKPSYRHFASQLTRTVIME
jgi:hypothetical protein